MTTRSTNTRTCPNCGTGGLHGEKDSDWDDDNDVVYRCHRCGWTSEKTNSSSAGRVTNARPPAVEVPYNPGPYGDRDLPDYLIQDGAPCQAAQCRSDPPAIVGFHLAIDSETGHDIGRWNNAWVLPDGRYICEDCAIAYDEGADL